MSGFRPSRLRAALLGMAALALAACEDGPVALSAGSVVEVSVTGLRAPAPDTEGSFMVWAHTSDGAAHLLGELGTGAAPSRFEVPVSGVDRFSITLEPPGDPDPDPSERLLMAGAYRGGTSLLSVDGSVTAGPPLNDKPGHHSLFTSSNNVELGYPSMENSGLWMFSISPSANRHGTREVMMTPLRRTWLYEGWAVYRYGTPDAVWISYGKFRPDIRQLLSSRDDTGSGPFSGDEDFRNGGIEDVPGEEWTVNPLGLPVPGGLELPFQLDAVDSAGRAVWTHVITIEPSFDEDEPLLSERPFMLQPYRNPVGPGGPGVPREIMFLDNMPEGVVTVVS
ncbi:MAG TPA: hypothetical protein VK966_00220 [Longimicrobiales bacterium]|nr:hypothetical protein [Longimicrobiales bacterium]